MSRMKSMLLLVGLLLVGLLLASGCASVRVTTDLKPEADPALKSPGGKFYVAGLKYAYVYRDKPELDAKYGRRLLSAVRKECVTRYPLLFAQDSANAISLGIEMNDIWTTHDGKMVAWMYGTVLLAGLIFPLPMQAEHDIDVKVSMWNGRDGIGSGRVRKDFRREEHAWVSMMTPLALITIPGKSDFPKVSTAFDFNRFAYDDVPQIAQQVATAIAKLITKQNSAIWNTTGQGPSDSGGMSPAPPPPKDYVAPF